MSVRITLQLLLIGSSRPPPPKEIEPWIRYSSCVIILEVSKDRGTWLCRSSDDQVLDCLFGGLRSAPGQFMWDIWWAEWQLAARTQFLGFPLPVIIPPLLHTHLPSTGAGVIDLYQATAPRDSSLSLPQILLIFYEMNSHPGPVAAYCCCTWQCVCDCSMPHVLQVGVPRTLLSSSSS